MKTTILSILLAFLSITGLQAQSKVFQNEHGVALGGYDLVAYFSQFEAVEGEARYASQHDGVTYHFSSEANQAAFEAHPDKYLPEFGGFCAYGVAIGSPDVPVNPETFKIRDGKLYFFFNGIHKGEPMNTVIPWNSDEKALLEAAETNWEKL